ncbi:MAG TPA: molybdopterin biosynthesis protein [Spirochaetota bacterium]|jgi:putative molybdopterin biosynthesis protein|nr:molybdopterin biosynthesis protein [Spirochaetota bacterium]HOF00741.1 molybdopterin biosynthesis protein [Spirochaetota bacterium]HOS32502.1 molybdopterin biosynthesis protein [Spirochaetota bacterium]HOS56020.1 molybdopterin biosynthesis protein [Spirochaetota bacterium]HPY87245.1 molybdopterin biosynthesis protein [Spirochaetota bacterium]
MNYKYLSNTELTAAVAEYMEILIENGIAPKEELIPVEKSLNRILSKAVYAKISNPNYNSGAMDGLAVKAQSTFNADETNPLILEKTDYLRVDTGDILPKEYDAVIMVEDVVDMEDGKIKILNAVSPWQNVRQIGEDICEGEMILPSFSRVTSAFIGAALSCGVTQIWALKRPVIALIPTGDEIVSPFAEKKEGEIFETNGYTFSALALEYGCVPIRYDIVKDNLDDIKQAVMKAVDVSDIVCLIGGSSAGRDDLSASVVSQLGKVVIHGLAIKPGKPCVLGVVANKPVIGIPGYPVSGILIFRLIVKKIVEVLNGVKFDAPEIIQAELTKKIVSSLKYEEFVRVKVGLIDGKYKAFPFNKGAGAVTSLVKTDGIVRIPQNFEGYNEGKVTDVELLRKKEEIDNALIIGGSHDPLIDEIIDICRINNREMYVSSSNIGSMAGLMAIKRKEAHLAGIHLLDEESGSYNINYIKEHFSEGETALIKCVKRIQGIIVERGNPKNIKSIRDLTNPDIRYVNRQMGSGTRILFDFELKKSDINPRSINGYDRVENTHIAVSLAVKSRTADAGLGVYSASKIYGLDFIPITEEEYDFLTLERFVSDKKLDIFVKSLKNPDFIKRIYRLGGYSYDKIGDLTII